MYVGLLLIAVTLSIAAYLILYYHYYLGIKDYDRHTTYPIPVATFSFISGMTV